MKAVKKVITLIVCLCFPSWLFFWLLNLLGHKIHRHSKIGFSLLWIDGTIRLESGSKIGRFNIIRIHELEIKKGGYIGNYNTIKGPIIINLAETAAIGNKNSIYRAPLGVTYGIALLKLGILSKITANHRIDCTRSVIMGDYTTIAGHDTQVWTHAYYHDKSGPGRFRLDGDVEIGNNVYIGSRCIINMGTKIANNVVVGANACISKSLLEAGTYVNQPLRYIAPSPQADERLKFVKVEGYSICEEVYERKKT